MQPFIVEGVYIPKRALKRVEKKEKPAPSDLEPFSQTFWANSAKEALMLATEAIAGGQWTQGPRISQISEEERMRSQGAPELPLFNPKPAQKRKRNSP